MASFPMLSRFKRLQPKTEAADDYSQHLEQTPTMEENSPSIWRRIAAGLAGGLTGINNPAAGMQIGEQIVNDPYNRALSEHSLRTKPLEHRAKLEQEANDAAYDFEKDMATREETARFHDMNNERWEEDREQRRSQAETVAAQKDAELGFREAELNRRKQADQMMANWRNRTAKTGEQRANAYGEFVNKYGQKQESDRVNPLDQSRIRKLAVIETMKDPKFAKVPVFEDGSYDTSKLDPMARQEFEETLKHHEAAIVGKKRKDYEFSGDADIRDEDFEFERRMQEEDEDDGLWR